MYTIKYLVLLVLRAVVVSDLPFITRAASYRYCNGCIAPHATRLLNMRSHLLQQRFTLTIYQLYEASLKL